MKVLEHNKPFFLLYIIFLVLGLLLVQTNNKLELFLILNAYHTTFLDQFFALFTHLGTPYFSIFLLGVCDKVGFNPNRMSAGYYIMGGLILLLSVFLLKEYFQVSRPINFDLIKKQYTQVPGTPSLYNNSFPSGHTATIFFTVTSYLMINKYKPIVQVGFLFLAVLVGYSRIYVGAHFLEDVLAGSYLGMMIPVILYCFFCKRFDAIFK